ncbi:hypothetical protein GGX14DRAFT_645997 [Mycena pura]|uniref:Uncharacterized protein n=1 Tax=Mycena pura TaxID=153505 RepID=A0AAD6V732_9AGAR|nr:hypothetical protein GGX14DRAFT_645997 [Mycena pura]
MPTPAAQQVEPDSTNPSPLDVADAAIQVEARFTKTTPSYTEEQRKAIRAIPMRDGDGGSLGPMKAYYIPSVPTTDPVASAYERERRRKMFALTKARFPDFKVPMPFVPVSENSEMESTMPTPAAQQVEPDSTTPSQLDVADAAIQAMARFTSTTPTYTEEQRKAIRAIPMRDGDGGSLGPMKGYHMPSMPTTAYERERRRKMFALTKARFPDLKVPMPFVPVSENSEMESTMPTPAAQQVEPDSTTPSQLDVADAAVQAMARFTGTTPAYTEEQRKAIRAIPMRDGDGGSLGPMKGYQMPPMPTTADERERRRKMFALTKAAFPDLKVPMPFVSVRARE